MYDLFNQPRQPNFTMIEQLQGKNLENPTVQVVWEDDSDSFSQERIKRIKAYFQQKYNTKNVNVITKIKTSENIIQDVDFSFNITDENFQRKLITEYLKEEDQEFIDKITNFDKSVNNEISTQDREYIPFKKWFLKKISFSNFLSYGENQVLEYSDLNGITVVESNPPNFGGKTILSVDLLLFLFFNTTTKTSKAEDIFNRFSSSDKVSVTGEIVIDGEEYVISRTIQRSKKRVGGYNVKSDLEFYKRFKDGSMINMTGEQRRETEEFIKKSIGGVDDFLMTIVTTGSNLEGLIDSKPTARGEILTRFLGLDVLKEKEEIAKGMYSTFSKQMLSNIYNIQKLKGEIDNYNELIDSNKKAVGDLEVKIKECEESLKKGKDFRDDLVQKRNTQINEDLQKMSQSEIELEITNCDVKIQKLKTQMDEVYVVEPNKFYDEKSHDDLVSELNQLIASKLFLEIEIENMEKRMTSYSDGFECEHCGLKLIGSDISKTLEGTISEKKEELGRMNSKIETWQQEDSGWKKLKEDFSVYEKNKLIKARYEIDIEGENLNKNKFKQLLKDFIKQQNAIEENKKIDALMIKADMRIEQLDSEKLGYNTRRTTLLNENDKYGESIKKNQDLIVRIEDEFEKEKVYKKYLELFGKNGISKVIMKKMIPVINSELTRLLMDSAHFRLEVIVNDKNEVEFLMVDNETQVKKLMASGSGYEKTIASLALRSVLSRICSLPKPDVVVFDEVFGKISNENLDMVLEFFTKIKKYFPKIFIISHNELINQWADNIVKVEKNENVSRVVSSKNVLSRMV
jgi:DNA repair exonuclease SbcCD ATPase subunit